MINAYPHYVLYTIRLSKIHLYIYLFTSFSGHRPPQSKMMAKTAAELSKLSAF